MYVYNTTFVCEESRLEEFLIWVDAEFIPAITSSGDAVQPQLAHVLPVNETEDNEASSFSVQVKLEDADTMEKWMKSEFFPAVDGLRKRFGEQVLFFATILEVLPIGNYN